MELVTGPLTLLRSAQARARHGGHLEELLSTSKVGLHLVPFEATLQLLTASARYDASARSCHTARSALIDMAALEEALAAGLPVYGGPGSTMTSNSAGCAATREKWFCSAPGFVNYPPSTSSPGP